MRSTCSPLRLLCWPVTSTVPAGSVIGPSHVVAWRASPAKAEATDPATRTGTVCPSTVDEVATAPGVERGRQRCRSDVADLA